MTTKTRILFALIPLFVGILMPTTVSASIFDNYPSWPPKTIHPAQIDIMRDITCVIETTRGTIRIELYPDSAPIHCANFVKLIEEDFYDGLTFHRVIADFVSQGGDPEGTGQGGTDYELPPEIELPHVTGSVCMARIYSHLNPGRLSNGSQFYICHSTAGTTFLDGEYTVFGQVIDGMKAVISMTATYSGYSPLDTEPDYITDAWIDYGGRDVEVYVYF